MPDLIPPRSGDAEALEPAVAGRWYPSDPDRLSAEVDRLLDEAPPADEVAPLGVIVPHAGYVYSGAVAASAFAGLRGRAFERVVLIGTSHYQGYAGARVPRAGALRTPLGELAVDRQAVARLTGRPAFGADDAPFRPEHALEAQLPFLQRTLRPGFRLLPVLVGGASGAADLDRVADGLREWCGAGSLLVVSTDFTHFGRAFGFVPFERDVPERLRELDLGAAEPVLRLDEAGFARYVARTGVTICGQTAVRVLLRLLPLDSRARLTAYDTSGRMTGDWSHSVSYAGLTFGTPGPGR